MLYVKVPKNALSRPIIYAFLRLAFNFSLNSIKIAIMLRIH
ncbi:hypothetical protein BN133_1271 [Cronobacter dublinensis 582]|nr:hypothetical protein BN133_1271 [Cronobacter dublinensis 582]